jgi:chitin disaccharide deacetylase
VSKLLIVNADDLGMTRGVNRGIVEAHRSGIVTSATLLANGPEFEDAVALVRAQAPRLAIGAHLNLSQFAPLSPSADIPTLVNAQGQFYLRPWRLWSRLVRGKIRASEVQTELRAQICRLLDAGFRPDHLDGHMHVHLLRGVREMVIDLAREFGIGAARCPMERPILPRNSLLGALNPGLVPRRVVAFSISQFAQPFCERLQQAGLRHADHFVGNYLLGHLNAHALDEVLHGVRPGVTELMCHPGYMDPALAAAGGSLGVQRQTEIEALTAPEIRALIDSQQITLSTYASLASA